MATAGGPGSATARTRGFVFQVEFLTKRGKLTKLEFLRSAGVAIARRRGSERRTRKCACHTRRERSKIVVEIDYGSFTPAGELPNRGFGRRPSPEMVDHLSPAETE